jgi:hypothetical protein
MQTFPSPQRNTYRFAHQQATTERQALPVGDYGIAHHDELVAVVERKSLADLTRRLVDGQLAYALADMATIPRAAVVVEDRYPNLFKLEHTQPGFVAEMLAALTVRYPTVPISFCETRPLAEEWTYRFLGAALAYHQAETQSASAPEPTRPSRSQRVQPRRDHRIAPRLGANLDRGT